MGGEMEMSTTRAEKDTTGENDENKRHCPRLPRAYRVQARELAFPLAKSPLLDVVCSDIGKGGLCVEFDSPLPVGTRLYVNVHIPLLNKFSNSFFKVYENDADQFFQAIAVVAWVKPVEERYRMGLRFINADQDLCRALGRLVDDACRNNIEKMG